MGSPYWTRIDVRIPLEWLDADGKPPWFVLELDNIVCDGEFGPSGTPVTNEETGRVEWIDDVTCWSAHGEANYGVAAAEELLAFYRDNEIPFTASDEPGPEGGAEVLVFDGSTFWRGSSDGDVPMMSQSDWEDIKAGVSQFSDPDDFFGKLNVRAETLSVDHLVGRPIPQQEDADVDA